MQFKLPIHAGGQPFVVCYQQQTGLEFPVQFQQQAVNMVSCALIQVAGRLVTQYHARVAHQGAGHGGTLALTTGKLPGFVVQPLREAYPAEQFERPWLLR